MSPDIQNSHSPFATITDHLVRLALGLLLFVILGGATFYHFVEGWNWLNSIYFTVITLATVGYGDLTPKTDAGKVFTIFYVFIGIGVFVTIANLFLRYRLQKGLTRHQKRSNPSKRQRQ